MAKVNKIQTRAVFVTGTDTEVGKTYVSTILLESLNKLGLKTLGLKPLASGCENKEGKLYNEDALKLQQASSIKCHYDKINPIRYKEPIAPNIAAQNSGEQLTLKRLNSSLLESLNNEADLNIIEGVGGWSVPLNSNERVSDLVTLNNFPVLLVIGIKLGCLNHAFLTIESILNKGAHLIGWIANIIDPGVKEIDNNILTLKRCISVPCLGIIQNNQKSHPPPAIDLKKITNIISSS